MPLDTTRPIGTSVLDDEDWCAHCRSKVKEWNVFLEYDSDLGDQQIHRCPCCNAKAHRDTFGIGGLFTFCGLFVGIALTVAAFPMDEKEAAGPAGLIYVAGMFAGVFLFGWLADCAGKSAYNRRKRKWEESQPEDPFDRQ